LLPLRRENAGSADPSASQPGIGTIKPAADLSSHGQGVLTTLALA